MRLMAIAAAALLVGSCSPQPRGGSPAYSSATGEQTTAMLAAVRQAAIPLRTQAPDYGPLIANMGGATRVLLGESTHGTHEYYRERARITMRLVREAGVNGIGIEGDWTPTYRVNRYVRGLGSDRSAREALRGYVNFPRWMWPNAEFADFVDQLRAHNLRLPASQRVGVYGMDVYDLYEAADAVVAHLQSANRAAARRVQGHYRCFAASGGNRHTYGATAQRSGKSCQAQAAAALAEVRKLPRPTDVEEAEAHFGAVRAASSVVAAEEYFRATYAGGNSWNLRDSRMAETVESIALHAQGLTGRPGKVVTWSHNTHTGDARATAAGQGGELNLGQLMKQRHGNRAYLLGFFTNGGTVFAASQWDQPGRRQSLRPARPDSYCGLFHRAGIPFFLLLFRGNAELQRHFSSPMLQRSVGVIYVPAAERQAHYSGVVLSRQFDAAIYFDQTQGVAPL